MERDFFLRRGQVAEFPGFLKLLGQGLRVVLNRLDLRERLHGHFVGLHAVIPGHRIVLVEPFALRNLRRIIGILVRGVGWMREDIALNLRLLSIHMRVIVGVVATQVGWLMNQLRCDVMEHGTVAFPTHVSRHAGVDGCMVLVVGHVASREGLPKYILLRVVATKRVRRA